jgi:phosphatidylglycerophosphate synthase
MSRLQVVIPVPETPALVAGLPVPVRAADAFRDGLKADRLIFYARSTDFASEWGDSLRGLPWVVFSEWREGRPLRDLVSADGSVLALSPEVMPDTGAVRHFIERAAAGRGPHRLVQDGRTFAAYYPDAEELKDALQSGRIPAGGLLAPADAVEVLADGDSVDWRSVTHPVEAAFQERRLFESLPQTADGYIARLDRRLSMALSKRLLPLPVTPNHITLASLVIGLSGAALLAGTSYPLQVLGALMLWSCCILDGCDGELARLKLMCSPEGARFDVLADNAVHLAIFIAIPVHIQKMHPGTDFMKPGLLLLSGFLLSAFWVWRLILARPESRRGPSAAVFERIASRDFIYLVLLLTIFRRLEWFLWAAASGSHLFWLALVGLEAFRLQRKAWTSPQESLL